MDLDSEIAELVDLTEDDYRVNTDKLVRMVAKYQDCSRAEARDIVQTWLLPMSKERTREEEYARRMHRDDYSRGLRYQRRAKWLHKNMNRHLAKEGVGVFYEGEIQWKAGVRYGDDADG